MTQIPTRPQISAEEIDAALVVAQRLEVFIGDEPIRPMQMEAILNAAFEFRHGRYNAELRKEAEGLALLVQNKEQELETIQSVRRSSDDVVKLADSVRRLLALLRSNNSWWIQAAEEYGQIQELLGNIDSMVDTEDARDFRY